jgi:hypothetical protein
MILATPPRSASARSSSSLVLRGRSASARHPPGVLISTGAFEAAIPPLIVRCDLWARSTTILSAFSRSIT